MWELLLFLFFAVFFSYSFAGKRDRECLCVYVLSYSCSRSVCFLETTKHQQLVDAEQNEEKLKHFKKRRKKKKQIKIFVKFVFVFYVYVFPFARSNFYGQIINLYFVALEFHAKWSRTSCCGCRLLDFDWDDHFIAASLNDDRFNTFFIWNKVIKMFEVNAAFLGLCVSEMKSIEQKKKEHRRRWICHR